jgi:3-hydroxymyristoyl/3-hydroxydecanoyl-(acyl carrier protein) dehydratase
MLEDELGLWVRSNPWISTFRVVDFGEDGGHARVQLGLSPKGHDLLCIRGLAEFKQAAFSRYPGDPEQPVCEFATVADHPELDRLFQAVNGFPRAISWLTGQSDHRLLLDVSAELCWFSGHFAGHPVLPGVVQLHWAACAAKLFFGHAEPPHRIDRLKFKKVVIPPQIVELRLEKPRPGEVQFEFSSRTEVHSEGRMKFCEVGSC